MTTWWPDDYEPLMVTGTVVEDGLARPFAFDTRTEQMVYDRFSSLHDPGQATLSHDERARIAARLADRIGPDVEVRIGEYLCPVCRCWIDVARVGAWGGVRCSGCDR